tara:strand:- start:459 stop:818 length:360 start_codon:yes stop_codon:yes gene_type:complete
MSYGMKKRGYSLAVPKDKSKMRKQVGLQIRKTKPNNPAKTHLNYAGAKELSTLAQDVNKELQGKTGTFGQSFKKVSSSDMAEKNEMDRASKAYMLKRLMKQGKYKGRAQALYNDYTGKK